MLNRSTFNNCNFSVDDTYYQNSFAHYGLAQRVTMYQVHGVIFTGNTFANNISLSNLYDINQRSGGIYSIDATYSLSNCTCINSYPPGGCCGIGNTLTGFGWGVAADNSNPSYNISITGNTFTDNFYDVDIQNINNMAITDNTFSKTKYEGLGLNPYNIYFDQCSDYNISGNSFTNSYFNNPPISLGTIMNNSGPLNNLINKNNYTGIYIQAQAQGVNGRKTMSESTGLFYQCNNFNSSVQFGGDIAVASTGSNLGSIDPDQGSNTNNTTTTNNTFNNDCSSRTNILTSPVIQYNILYSFANLAVPEPYCATAGTVNLHSCGLALAGICTSSTYTLNVASGNLLLADGINYHAGLRNQKQSFKLEKDSLNGILAKGNTSGLFAVLETGTSASVILDSLLTAGPYLSDSVLKTAIRATLPYEILADILIPNTPLDSSVVSTLDGIGLPDTLVKRLNEYQSDSSISPRNELIAGINYFQGLMDFTDNALITALETDSTIVSPFDSAQTVLKSDSLTLPRLAELASFQWSAGENSTALITLDTIQKRDKDSTYYNYCRQLPVLFSLNSATSGYLSLKGDSKDSTLLEQIAMDTLRPGYANARAILKFVFNQDFAEPIIPIDNHSGHNPKKHNDNLYITSTDSKKSLLGGATGNQFNLYPNPANSSLSIEYSLNSSQQEVNIIMYDVLGNKVANWVLPGGVSSNSIVNENISSIEPGIYFYTIFEDNKAAQRGKLVIER